MNMLRHKLIFKLMMMKELKKLYQRQPEENLVGDFLPRAIFRRIFLDSSSDTVLN